MTKNNYLVYCTKEEERKFLLSLHLLEGEEKSVLKALYSVSNHLNKHYEYLEIAKKDGSKRILYAPDYLLKKIQKNILHHVIDGMSISSYACAYKKGADVVKNASSHIKKQMILKIDIKDFFSHITFYKVKSKVFKEEYFPDATATLLTHLCCYQGILPQGAPTSPTISNIILKEFDETIGNWCKEKEIDYTRYSDDMTFSGNFNKNEIIDFVKKELQSLGFQLNTKKTKILKKGHRQVVTGIVVNEHVQTSKHYRKEIRKQVYYCRKFGVQKHLQNINLDIDTEKYLQSLKGKILFVLHANPVDTEFKKYLDWIKKYC